MCELPGSFEEQAQAFLGTLQKQKWTEQQDKGKSLLQARFSADSLKHVFQSCAETA